MSTAYDKYYQNPDYFGEAYPELLNYFKKYDGQGKVLDMGCGQGRDAIPLARMGFEVIGLDSSKVGVEQVNECAVAEGLKLKAYKADIYEFKDFESFDFVLYNSMFHFEANDRQKELGLIDKAIEGIGPGCRLVFCIQDSGSKVDILLDHLGQNEHMQDIEKSEFLYVFKDPGSDHRVEVRYKLVTCLRS